MNKELIQKYPNEFNHFLKGGNLWFNSSMWQKLSTNSDLAFNWYYPEKIKAIVIDDELVEVRKALADGIPVQVRVLGLTEWADITGKNYFFSDNNNYRIKPSPVFKVGDWVTRFNDNDTIYGNQRVAKIVQIEADYAVCDLQLAGSTTYMFNEIKPWKPIQNEWCWVRDFKCNEPHLGRYSGAADLFYTWTDTIDMTSWKIYEPFIGELPTGPTE